MPPKKNEDPGKIRELALKTIEKIATSPEEGAELIKQLGDAHKILEDAMNEAESPEEELPLRIALQEIKSIEEILAAGGRRKRLTAKEKETLSSLSDELRQKVEGLDVLIDVVNFKNQFYKNLHKRNSLVSSLQDEVLGDLLSPLFKAKADNILKASKDLQSQYYSYLENLNLNFEHGQIPAEIQSEFDKMLDDLVKMELSDKLIINSTIFEDLIEEFNTNSSDSNNIDYLRKLQSSLVALKEDGIHPALNDLMNNYLNKIFWSLNLKTLLGADEKPLEIMPAKDLEEMLNKLYAESDNGGLSYEKFKLELDWIVANILYSPEGAEKPQSPAFYEKLIKLVEGHGSRSGLKTSINDEISQISLSHLSEQSEIYSVLGVLYQMLHEAHLKIEQQNPAANGLMEKSSAGDKILSDKYTEAGMNFALLFQIQELNKTVKIRHLDKNGPLKKFLENGWITITSDGIFEYKIYQNSPEKNCPVEIIPELHASMEKQFMIEQIYATEEELSAIPEENKDEFFQSTLLLVQSQKALIENDEDKFRALGVKFVQSLAGKNNISEEMINARRQTIAILKGLSIKSLSRLSKVAQYLFGNNENHQNFLNGALISINQEIRRLSEGDEIYTIEPSGLRQRHFSEEHIGLIGGSDARISAEKSTPGELKSREGIARARLKALEREDRLNTPQKSVIDLWNQVVSVESNPDPEVMSNPEKRKLLYQNLAGKFREVKGGAYFQEGKIKEEDTTHFTGAGGIYSRLALSDRIADMSSMYEETRVNLRKQIEAEKEEYVEKAVKLVEEMLEKANKDVIFAGQDVPESKFQAWKAALQSGPSIVQIAENLMDEKADMEIEKLVFAQFENEGVLSGVDAESWRKLESMEGIFDSWSDENARFMTDELINSAFIIMASMAFGMVVEAGAEAIALATFGLKAAQLSRSANIMYRAYLYSSKVAGFTAAEKALTQLASGSNTWGHFGRDFGVNMLTFMAVDAGGAMWSKLAGKYLVGERSAAQILFPVDRMQGDMIASKLFHESGKVSQQALKIADFAGKSFTAVQTLTAMQIGQSMIRGASFDDLNKKEMYSKNAALVLALHGGQMFFTPVLRPLNEKLETRRTRMIEDADPTYFLDNYGLKADFFASDVARIDKPAGADGQAEKLYEARVTESKLAAMDRLRNFVDGNRLSPDYFKDKSRSEIDRTMTGVDLFFKAHEKNGNYEIPSAEKIMELYEKNREAFIIVVRNLRELPLKSEDIHRIYDDSPDLLLFFAEKIPSFRPWLLDKVREDSIARAKSGDASLAELERARAIEEVASGSKEVVTDSLIQMLLNGEEGFAKGLAIIQGMNRLTLSARQVLYLTSNLPEKVQDLFLKTCAEKMTPLQKFLLEEAVAADEAYTGRPRDDGSTDSSMPVDEIYKGGSPRMEGFRTSVGGKVRLAMAAGAVWVAGKVFEADSVSVKPANINKANAAQVLKEGFDYDRLSEAAEGARFVVVDVDRAMEAPRVVNETLLVEGWKSKSQGEIASEMARLGVPDGFINEIIVKHAELPAELQPFVKITAVPDGDSFNSYILIDYAGIQQAFGVDFDTMQDLLKQAGVLAPANLEELAKYTGIPREMIDTMAAMFTPMISSLDAIGGKSAMKAGLFDIFYWFSGIGLAFEGGKFFVSRWLEKRRTNQQITNRLGPAGAGGPPLLGPGAAPLVPNKATFDTIDTVIPKTGVLKLGSSGDPTLTDKLSTDQITSLRSDISELREVFEKLTYIDPANNIQKLYEISVEIAYIEARLNEINTLTSPTAASPGPARPAQDIRDELEIVQARIQATSDAKLPSVDADLLRRQALNKELAAVTAPGIISGESSALLDKLKVLQGQYEKTGSGVFEFLAGSEITGSIGKITVIRGGSSMVLKDRSEILETDTIDSVAPRWPRTPGLLKKGLPERLIGEMKGGPLQSALEAMGLSKPHVQVVLAEIRDLKEARLGSGPGDKIGIKLREWRDLEWKITKDMAKYQLIKAKATAACTPDELIFLQGYEAMVARKNVLNNEMTSIWGRVKRVMAFIFKNKSSNYRGGWRLAGRHWGKATIAGFFLVGLIGTLLSGDEDKKPVESGPPPATAPAPQTPVQIETERHGKEAGEAGEAVETHSEGEYERLLRLAEEAEAEAKAAAERESNAPVVEVPEEPVVPIIVPPVDSAAPGAAPSLIKRPKSPAPVETIQERKIRLALEAQIRNKAAREAANRKAQEIPAK